ncbi:MAG: hypothetical protein ACI9AX_001988 [Polaromonas sp.]|jgi:hypothetical protein
MAETLPDVLIQGEPARLFPVLSTTSKEGRTTSIVLACLCYVEEFGAALLAPLGQRIGARASLDAYTEVVCAKSTGNIKDRPDGLLVVKRGQKEWRALVEAKIGAAELDVDQIERYRALAKDNDIDCVITISNQFATSPSSHPLEAVRKSRSKIPVFHWSWMTVLTAADLLISKDDIQDSDQRTLLNELRRFLTHESAGVKGFDRMPAEWGDLNKLVSSGGGITAKSTEAAAVLEAWHQETRDLTLILSRLTETVVEERLPRKHRDDPAARQKDELALLREARQLCVTLQVPDAAAPLVVTADIARRCIDVGMTLRAPEDRVSTKARVNWILRQVKTENAENLFVRLHWPGRAEPTQHAVSELRANPDLAAEGRGPLAPHGFDVFASVRLGARFAQRVNFIVDLEMIVPEFYRTVGSE